MSQNHLKKIILLNELQLGSDSSTLMDESICECDYCVFIRRNLRLMIANLFIGILIPLTWSINVFMILYAFTVLSPSPRPELRVKAVPDDEALIGEIGIYESQKELSHTCSRYKGQSIILYSLASIIIYSIILVLLFYGIIHPPRAPYRGS